MGDLIDDDERKRWYSRVKEDGYIPTCTYLLCSSSSHMLMPGILHDVMMS
jgi:hypothetical protein